MLGLFGCGNFGNDASLDAMLSFLRQSRPDLELVCICSEPDLVRARHGVATLAMDWSRSPTRASPSTAARLLKIPGKLFDLVHLARHVGRFDLLLIPGTGILDDFGEHPWGMPYQLLKWCAAARLCGTKIAFVSIGAGPINNRLNRWLMTSAARMAHYRSYRDVISQNYMTGIGVETDAAPVYPDIVFELPAPECGSTRRRERLTVGVGVMSYSGWYHFASDGPAIYAAYVGKMTRFILWLLGRGDQVRILTGETSDKRAVGDILEGVRKVRPDLLEDDVIYEPAVSIYDLMRHISDTDIVVATRFHNVVCALKLGRPTISLGYAKKNDVLLADVGLGEFCQHVEELDLDRLMDQFSRLVANREHYEDTIRSAVRTYEDRLATQNAILLERLLLSETH